MALIDLSSFGGGHFAITGLIVQNPAWQTPYLDLGHINTSRTNVCQP